MPSRTPLFSVPEARTKKNAEKMPQKPPKRDSFFVVEGLVPRPGFPYEEVVPQTGLKGLRSASRVGFGEHLGQKNGRISSNIWAEYGYSLSIQNSNKKWRALRPVFLTFGCVFRQAEYRFHISLICSPTSFANTMGGTIRSKTQKTHARLQLQI